MNAKNRNLQKKCCKQWVQIDKISMWKKSKQLTALWLDDDDKLGWNKARIYLRHQMMYIALTPSQEAHNSFVSSWDGYI